MNKFVSITILAVIALFIVTLSLLIKQPVEMPERKVNLGYPKHFYTLDYSSPTTSMGGAPDYVLEKTKFNVSDSWEENSYVSSWKNLIVSISIVFSTISIFTVGINSIRGKL